MFRRLNFGSDTMGLALGLWLCSLPLVGLLVLPLFGLRAAGGVALALLIAAMAACWGICGWKVFRDWGSSP